MRIAARTEAGTAAADDDGDADDDASSSSTASASTTSAAAAASASAVGDPDPVAQQLSVVRERMQRLKRKRSADAVDLSAPPSGDESSEEGDGAAAAPAPAAAVAATEFQHGERVDLVGKPKKRVRDEYSLFPGATGWCCADGMCTYFSEVIGHEDDEQGPAPVFGGQGVQCRVCNEWFHRRSCGEKGLCALCIHDNMSATL